MNKGYELIGLGGLVGAQDEGAVSWLDRIFDLVCDQPSRLPKVKLHGFGVTIHRLLVRFPWWSVDSTTWTRVGGFGGILVPRKQNGRFDFGKSPYVIKVSMESPARKELGRHYTTLTTLEKKIVGEWLELINLPLGMIGSDGKMKEPGVMTTHTVRRAANLLFFEELRKNLPEWPWPFRKSKKGFLALETA